MPCRTYSKLRWENVRADELNRSMFLQCISATSWCRYRPCWSIWSWRNWILSTPCTISWHRWVERTPMQLYIECVLQHWHCLRTAFVVRIPARGDICIDKNETSNLSQLFAGKHFRLLSWRPFQSQPWFDVDSAEARLLSTLRGSYCMSLLFGCTSKHRRVGKTFLFFCLEGKTQNKISRINKHCKQFYEKI